MRYTTEDLIWLAGFIDGEGCVSWIKSKGRPSRRFEIRIANTNLSVMEWIHQCFGGYLYEFNPNNKKAHHKQCYHWYIRDWRAVELHEQLKLYLKIK